MRLLILFILFTAISTVLPAQVSIGTVKYNKLERPCIKSRFDYSPEIVRSGFMESMKYNGFMVSSDRKGFRVFTGIVFHQLSSEPLDLYCKIENVRKQPNQADITLMFSRGAEDFISLTDHPALYDSCSLFLDNLKPKLAARQLEISITEQEMKIRKAEIEFNSMVGKEATLQNRKKELEERIAKNRKEQEEQKSALERERQLLETLKKQRLP